MAIKPNRNKRKLTNEQVLDIRGNFFRGMESIEDIAYRYPVSARTISDAIHGKGSYKGIPDDLEWHEKENRIQWRTFTSSAKSRKAREQRQAAKFMKELQAWQEEQYFNK